MQKQWQQRLKILLREREYSMLLQVLFVFLSFVKMNPMIPRSEIKGAVQRVIAAAKRVAANPDDQQALKELADAQKFLLDKLNSIRRDAHLGILPLPFFFFFFF